MTQLISVVAGAVVAALATWLLTKKRPTYIQCDLLHDSFFHLGLQGIRFLVRDEAIDHFGVARFRFYNTGSKVIKEPCLTLCLPEHTKVMSLTSRCIPAEDAGRASEAQQERETEASRASSGRSSVQINGSAIHISVDYLFPHELNSEELILDVFTDVPVNDVRVFGQGILPDGTGWAARYATPASPHKLWKNPLVLANRLVMFALFASLAVFLATRCPWRLFTLNSALATKALRDPFLWSWLGACAVFMTWMFILGMQGRVFRLRIPLLGRTLAVHFLRE